MLRSTKLAVAAAVVLVTGVGWLLVRPAPTPEVAAPDTPEDQPPVSAPTADVGAGDRSEQGVLDAALAFVELGEDAAVASINELEQLWREVATPTSVDRLLEDDLARQTATRERWPAGIPTRNVVADTRVTLTGSRTATVDLWVVQILSIPDQVAAQHWVTARYDLAWHDNRWLIDDVNSTPGPTPALSPTAPTVDATTLAALLDGWDRT